MGGVAKVVGVALKIKEAADTVRQNKKDCHHIKSRIEILNKTLSQHGNNMELMEDSAVMAALEALDKILGEALEVIIECQEERNIICVYYTSGKLSRQLSKVEQRISHLNSDVMLTIMSYQLPRKYQDGVPPLHSQVHSSIRTPFHSQAMQPPSLPQKMTKQYQDEADKQVRIQTSQRDGLLPRFIEWKGAGDLSFKHMLQSAQAYEVAPPVTIDSEWDDPPVRVDSAWDSSINFFPRARAYALSTVLPPLRHATPRVRRQSRSPSRPIRPRALPKVRSPPPSPTRPPHRHSPPTALRSRAASLGGDP